MISNIVLKQSNLTIKFMKHLKRATLCARDPFNLLRRLSHEESMVHDMVKAYADQELRPRINRDFNNGYFNRQIIKDMGETLGILGMTTMKDPVSYKAYGVACNVLEGVDSSYRSMLSVQSSLVIYPIVKYANESVKARYIDGLRSGEFLGSFCLTEPDAGSDPSSMRTAARKDGNDYIISGIKTWITHAPHAEVFVVWCKLGPDEIGGFVLDRSMDGIVASHIEDKQSMRASSTGTVMFNDVKVDKAHLLSVRGLKGPLSCLNQARFGISWGVLGAAADCIQQTLEYADQRIVFERALSSFQIPQLKLADCVSNIGTGLAAAHALSEDKEDGSDKHYMTSILKRRNCQTAMDSSLVCRDILGANGITSDYSPMRHLLNLQSVSTYEGTSDIHGLIIGKELTGIGAFV